MKAAMLCHSLVVVDDKQNIDVQFAKGSPTGQVQKRASQEQLKMSEMNWADWYVQIPAIPAIPVLE